MMQISEFDIEALKQIRKNVDEFVSQMAVMYGKPNTHLLDIAPQVHKGAAPFFTQSIIDTLDIDTNSGATFIADICKSNNMVPKNHYDYIVCTEVLEHTLQPFDAVKQIYSFLKPGGLAFVSTPFNFRIHGPLPDCWRFTEHGLRALFHDFEILSLQSVDTPDRFLMPIHYTLIARKP